MPRVAPRAQRKSTAYNRKLVVTGFGVEVEFVAYDGTWSRWERMMNRYVPFVYLDEDGSVHSDSYNSYMPAEMKFGPFHFEELGGRRDAMRQFHRSFAALAEFSAEREANQSCGLHVHIGFAYQGEDGRLYPPDDWQNNRQMMRLIRSWRYFEPVFFSMVPQWRRRAGWARQLADQPLTRVRARMHGERFHALNVCSLAEHGTIEFRLPPGTTDERQITAWINTLLNFCEYATQVPLRKQVRRDASTIDARSKQLRRLIKDANSRRFIQRRIERYGEANLTCRPLEITRRRRNDAASDTATV